MYVIEDLLESVLVGARTVVVFMHAPVPGGCTDPMQDMRNASDRHDREQQNGR